MAPYEDLKKISLTLVVDKTNNKVLFAEAGSEFVDVLLSFFTLTLGTISKLVSKDSSVQPCKFNCISSLRQSIENLDPKYFLFRWAKKRLLRQGNLVEACRDDLEYNLAGFVVYDDLKVMPCDVTTTLSIVRDFKRCARPRDTTCQYLSEREKPLTDLFLKVLQIQNCETQLPHQFKFDTSDIGEIKEGKKMKLKVMMETSKKKILFAQAEDEFVDQLLSFLTIPLGAVEHLAKANSGLVCIDNLYKSVADLDSDETRYFGSLFSNPMGNFIDPCIIGPEIDSQMLPIPIMDLCHQEIEDSRYVRQETTYMVTNDLSVQPFSCAAALSIMRESKVGENDLEERDIRIGVNEVMGILKASLTSSSALTIGLSSLLTVSKKRKRILK